MLALFRVPVDGRGVLARRFRDLQACIVQDLGGVANCCETMLQLVRTTAGLVILREDMDAKAVNGWPIDISAYVRISGALRRCLSTLGLRRVPRDVTPTLAEYIAAKRIFAKAFKTKDTGLQFCETQSKLIGKLAMAGASLCSRADCQL